MHVEQYQSLFSILKRKLWSMASLSTSEKGMSQMRVRALENLRKLRLELAGGTIDYLHPNGFPYLVHPSVPETRNMFVRGRTYEEIEAQIMSDWLEAGDFVVDCGANIGMYSAHAANCVGDTGQVWAVEASPSTRIKLELVLKALGLTQVKVIAMAIASGPGEVMFSNEESSSESNAICNDAGSLGSKSVCRVPTISIEELISSNAPRHPSMVKIDIEGAEPLAFQGWTSLSTTSHLPLLLFEVYPSGLIQQGFVPNDLFKALPLDRYTLMHVNISWPNEWPEFPRGKLFPLRDPFNHPWPTHSNVIAVPKEGVFSGRFSRIAQFLPPL